MVNGIQTANPHVAEAVAPGAYRFTPVQWGMLSFLASEVAFFSTLIVAYVAFLGSDQTGPMPKVLSITLAALNTLCLLASSATVHLADKRQRSGDRRGFIVWWTATIALGSLFLIGTGVEWHNLITREHLTIGSNLFGSTFYTLVGFHAFHVTAGVIAMCIVLGLALGGTLTTKQRVGAEMVSWYWHFVDGVWIVVFTLVYLLGR